MPPVEPRDRVESRSDAGCEVLQLRNDSAQVDGLAKLSVCIGHLALRGRDPCTYGIASRLQLLQIERSDFVGIHQSLQAPLLGRKATSSFIAAIAKLRGDAIAALAARPLVEHSRRILQQLATTLSTTVGMPRGRNFPGCPTLGMSTLVVAGFFMFVESPSGARGERRESGGVNATPTLEVPRNKRPRRLC